MAKKEFTVSDEVKKIAEEVMKNENIDLRPAKIEYLLVYPNIQKTVAGRCVRTGKELKFFSGFDYLIEISGELWDALDDSIRYVLVQHELMHVLPVMNEKTGDWQMKIRDHDIQDFSNIIKKHGIDWIDQVKLSIGSIYDLSPSEEDSIKI